MSIIDLGDMPLPPLPEERNARGGRESERAHSTSSSSGGMAGGAPGGGGVPAFAADPGNPVFFSLIDQDAPLMTVTVAHFRGASILRVRISHTVVDGTAFSDFVAHWAACFRAAPQLAVSSLLGAAPESGSSAADASSTPPAPAISPAPVDDRSALDSSCSGGSAFLLTPTPRQQQPPAAAAWFVRYSRQDAAAQQVPPAVSDHAGREVRAGELEKQACFASLRAAAAGGGGGGRRGAPAAAAPAAAAAAARARGRRRGQRQRPRLQQEQPPQVLADEGGGRFGPLVPLTSKWSPLGGISGLIPASEMIKMGLRGAQLLSWLAVMNNLPLLLPLRGNSHQLRASGFTTDPVFGCLFPTRHPPPPAPRHFHLAARLLPPRSSPATFDESMGFKGSGVGMFRVRFSRLSLAALKREAIASARASSSAAAAGARAGEQSNKVICVIAATTAARAMPVWRHLTHRQLLAATASLISQQPPPRSTAHLPPLTALFPGLPRPTSGVADDHISRISTNDALSGLIWQVVEVRRTKEAAPLRPPAIARGRRERRPLRPAGAAACRLLLGWVRVSSNPTRRALFTAVAQPTPAAAAQSARKSRGPLDVAGSERTLLFPANIRERRVGAQQ